MINSLGAGSGLDLATLVSNLVALERQSAQGPLDRRQLRAEVSLSALGSLKSSVAGLKSALSTLDDLAIGRTVSSSFDTAVNGTATPTADIGSYLINVTQVAVAQSLATDSANKFADADAALGEGTLTVSVGTETVALTLASGQNSLRNVRDAINASDLDIQASVVQDGAEYRLLLTSGQTGTAGVMSLTVDGTIDTRLASANMDETLAAQDAVYSVNGLGLTSSSNTVSDVLPGVTLELLTDTGGQSVVVDVGSDTDDLGSKLAAVLTAYNALVKNMSALGGASSDGSQAGPLVGDASLRSLQRQVATALYTNRATEVSENPFANLTQLGLHMDLSGTATLDASELDAALSQNEAGVAALVAEFAAEFAEQLEAFDGSDGVLTIRVDQLNAELTRIGREREDVERRIGVIEARLRAKFSALDALVTQFNNTSSFLEQQLQNLQALTRPTRRS